MDTLLSDSFAFSSDDILINWNNGGSVDAGDGNDILVGGAADDTLNGDAGDDILIGLGGNNILSGGVGNDIITGGGIGFISNGTEPSTLVVTADTNGIDTLSGGEGADRFVLGGNSNADPGAADPPVILYNEANNNDYALITDFDATQDIIALGGSQANYRLAASPAGLPVGTALYLGDELIAIIQGSSNLSMSASYFQGSVS
jgi:serralysin